DTEPRVAVEGLELEAGGDERPQPLGGQAPVLEEEMIPLHLHRPGRRRRWVLTVGRVGAADGHSHDGATLLQDRFQALTPDRRRAWVRCGGGEQEEGRGRPRPPLSARPPAERMPRNAAPGAAARRPVNSVAGHPRRANRDLAPGWGWDCRSRRRAAAQAAAA